MEQQRPHEDGEKGYAGPIASASLDMLDLLDEGVFRVDKDFRVTHVNASGAKLLGVTPEGIRGRLVWEAAPGSWCPSLNMKLRRVLEGASTEAFEVYCPMPSRVWLNCRCVPMDGGAVVTMQDITRWKSGEEPGSELQKRMQWRWTS